MVLNSFFINSRIKSIIVNKGIKFKKVSEETGIEYQRLTRIFNQNAVMAATETVKIISDCAMSNFSSPSNFVLLPPSDLDSAFAYAVWRLFTFLFPFGSLAISKKFNIIIVTHLQ